MNISVETFRLKIRNELYIPLTAKKRAHQLKHNDFTIISNNCWAGTVYESYNLPKLTPTVGMFIMPDDYLKFIENLSYYMNQSLFFISSRESKWLSELEYKDNWGTYLIGKLDDIELHMLHYHDEMIAKQKWESRVKRVNYDKIIYKFNDQNGCKKEHIQKFINLSLDNKLCFVSSKEMYFESEDIILIKQPSRYKEGIKASREPFGRSGELNLTTYINQIGE